MLSVLNSSFIYFRLVAFVYTHNKPVIYLIYKA